uniref:GBD/FH3 domain-containing protein n=1 Tax=Heterorhabditis bacteriophora TaxID=37862 RepID=A0A1I7XRV6_HETBA
MSRNGVVPFRSPQPPATNFAVHAVIERSAERKSGFFGHSPSQRSSQLRLRVRGHSVDSPLRRQSTMIGPGQAILPPMPPDDDLTVMFDEVLKQMDLPVDKMRILKNYNKERKWKLVVDQKGMNAHVDPSEYLTKLSYFLSKKTLKKNKKVLGDETSTAVLKHIEISLRTNSVDWVILFLNPPNNGLQVLVEYMNQLLMEASCIVQILPQVQLPIVLRALFLQDLLHLHYFERVGNYYQSLPIILNVLNMHYLQRGFELVFDDSRAIYCIVRSILHQSLRYAFFLIYIGIIPVASYITSLEFHVEFLSSAVQFMDIFSSVDDVNHRVYLQYELSILGFDDYIETMADCESEELQARISAYANGIIDVAMLMEDSQQKAKLIEECASLKARLSHVCLQVQHQTNSPPTPPPPAPGPHRENGSQETSHPTLAPVTGGPPAPPPPSASNVPSPPQGPLPIICPPPAPPPLPPIGIGPPPPPPPGLLAPPSGEPQIIKKTYQTRFNVECL